ncbi:MAG: diguanylate cyclase with and sensor [Firmicutes bacterium]|nr:diguanylate cyclase with and sensor [Bacillota bacterium]
MANKNYAGKIAVTYLFFGVIWILFSDSLVAFFIQNKDSLIIVSVVKGWIYVLLTALLIYLMSSFYMAKLDHAAEKLQTNLDELITTHEELMAAEEELKQQLIDLMQANETILNQNAVLLILQETATTLLNQLDVRILLEKIVRNAAALIGANDGFICLLNERNNNFVEFNLGIGVYKHLNEIDKIKPYNGLAGLVFQTGKTQVVNNYQSWEHSLTFDFLDTVTAGIASPIKSGPNVIGVIAFAYTKAGQVFTNGDVEILEQFASLASIAIDNAFLNKQIQQELVERRKKEEILKAIFDAANDAIVIFDAHSLEILNINPRAVETFGYSLEEVQKMGIAKLDRLHNNGQLVESLKETLKLDARLFESVMTDRAGNRLHLESSIKQAVIGSVECVIAVIRDVSERRKMEVQLAHAQNQKLAVLKASPDLLILINREGVFLECYVPADSKQFAEPDKIIGKNIRDVFSGPILSSTLEHLQQGVESSAVQILEYQLTLNSQVHDFEARFVKSGGDEMLVVIRDITTRKRAVRRLEYLSLHDAMTKVYNRAYFESQIQRLQSRNEKSVGIIVCDVDGLKLINDTLGHRSGDELLKIVADLLIRACTSVDDVIARIGGDEFAIIVFEPNQQRVDMVTTAIKAAVKEYNDNNALFPLSLSIGFAVGSSQNLERIFKEADNNMYREKMHQSLSMRNALVEAMMRALEARDYITEGHADRLQYLVVELAKKTGVPSQRLADLRLLAKFHDIGKVGIPDSILFKSSALTAEEAAIMRSHCEIGFRIAKSAPDLAPIADWVLKHQEWWNGMGYPLGLAGEAIPLECRILAIADAYDAMTSDRPYRKAMDETMAIEELKRCIGTQFDPELTEPFIQMILEKSGGKSIAYGNQ